MIIITASSAHPQQNKVTIRIRILSHGLLGDHWRVLSGRRTNRAGHGHGSCIGVVVRVYSYTIAIAVCAQWRNWQHFMRNISVRILKSYVSNEWKTLAINEQYLKTRLWVNKYIILTFKEIVKRLVHLFNEQIISA